MLARILDNNYYIISTMKKLNFCFASIIVTVFKLLNVMILYFEKLYYRNFFYTANSYF